MKSTEKFRMIIADGIIPMPKTHGELISIVDQYRFILEFPFDMDLEIELAKDAFVDMHEKKAGGENGCYISRISDGIMGQSRKRFAEVFSIIEGKDLIKHVIERLIVEERIKIIGKKVYLIGEENE